MREQILNMVNLCSTLDGFRCGIFIMTEKERDTIYELLKSIYPSDRGKGIAYTKYEGHVHFDNRSVIQIIFHPSLSLRAKKFHKILISESLKENEEMIIDVFPYMIIPYYCNPEIEYIKDDA